MNEHLKPIFETVLPALESVGIPYWVYGGVAIAGVNGSYLRHNPDVDVFVVSENFDRAIAIITDLETRLGWEHKDARPQRGRRKTDWYVTGSRRDIFSVVPVFRDRDRVKFIFEQDFVPHNSLSSVIRTIGPYRFTTPSKQFLNELLTSKANRGNLLRERKKKLRIDARVIMEDDEYEKFCESLK